VERPLVEKKLEAIDASLQKGLTNLNWNSHRINDYIAEVMSAGAYTRALIGSSYDVFGH
jgi:hypothetical protein